MRCTQHTSTCPFTAFITGAPCSFPLRHCPIAPLQVWDSAAPGHISWDARDVGAERMGVVAENTLLQVGQCASGEMLCATRFATGGV